MWTTVNRSGSRTLLPRQIGVSERCAMAGRYLPASAASAPKTWRSSRPSSSGCRADEQLADWGELRVTSQPGWLLPCQSTDYEAQLPPQHPGHRRVMITVPEQRPHVYHGLMTMV